MLAVANEQKVRGLQRVPSDSKEFHEATKRDALIRLRKDLDNLLQTADDVRKSILQKEMCGFEALFHRFWQEDGPSVEWDRIQKLPEDAVKDYSSLKTPQESEICKMLNRLVVVKLNGCLNGPKSVIPVRNDLTFLNLTVQQIEHLNKKYGANVPLVLMHPFNTDEDTEKVIRKYKRFQVKIYTFNQSCYPRVSRDSLLPVAKDFNIETISKRGINGAGGVVNSGLLKSS
ncbi:UTP--glucose-1-phosphate uridylyltransferase-like [Ochlerotatus camptorhynchus]|uniref:UTP--glucose-1-phosphate uridylyltransferase-like n=1 Tax=Ochlerotatus camptorhynchus TaxID=644619 RepID=UPI0031CF5D3E